jgi:sarcosine oxidase
MTATCDVIVLGLGGMGCAAAAQLSRRGLRVLGLEQYALGHDRGASHGETRLIRKAYFESPRYVPMLERAYQMWDELADRSGAALLHRVGLALCAAEGAASGPSGPFDRALATAEQFGLSVEMLTAAQVRARWPPLQIPDGFRCLYEPGAGFLEVERCVLAHAELARDHGAELRSQEPVLEWSASPQGVEVVTAKGCYSAGALVVAAGPWSAPVLAQLALPLRVHRVMQLWFAAPEEMSVARGMPCFAFDADDRFIYGFPRWGAWGSKICEHAAGVEVDPRRLDHVDRSLVDSDVVAVAQAIAAYLPQVDPRPLHSKACFYTMTPDQDFIIDTHPHHRNVHIAAGFSGHGFKFSAVVGEILADLVTRGSTDHPIDFLRLRWPTR